MVQTLITNKKQTMFSAIRSSIFTTDKKNNHFDITIHYKVQIGHSFDNFKCKPGFSYALFVCSHILKRGGLFSFIS